MALDEAIHQANRLRLMATLFSYRQMAFAELKAALGLSDGNLALHTARLVAAGYVAEGRRSPERGSRRCSASRRRARPRSGPTRPR